MRRAALVLILSAVPSLAAQRPARYQITHTFVLGGVGRWDYVIPDPPRHRVFIARQDRVMVVDENDGKLLGEIRDIHGAHGVALVEKAHHGFATSGNDSAVVMFDPSTFQVLGQIPAAEDADAIVYDAASNRLFSGCRSGVLAVSDYQAGRVVATAPIGAGVDGTAFDPAASDVFASNADGTLTVIHEDSPDQYHVVENVQTAQGGRNVGLDPTTHRIYVVSARFGPPPADSTAANPRRRPPIIPGSFMMMVVEQTPAPH